MNAADALMSVFGLARKCTHGSGPASACSQCLGARARRVEFVDGRLFVDGRQVDRSEPLFTRAKRVAV